MIKWSLSLSRVLEWNSSARMWSYECVALVPLTTSLTTGCLRWILDETFILLQTENVFLLNLCETQTWFQTLLKTRMQTREGRTSSAEWRCLTEEGKHNTFPSLCISQKCRLLRLASGLRERERATCHSIDDSFIVCRLVDVKLRLFLRCHVQLLFAPCVCLHGNRAACRWRKARSEA